MTSLVSLIEKHKNEYTPDARKKAVFFSLTLVILADEFSELKEVITNHIRTILSGLEPCLVEMECITQKALTQCISENKQLTERVISSLKAFLTLFRRAGNLDDPFLYIKGLAIIQFLDNNKVTSIQNYESCYFWGIDSKVPPNVFKEVISESQLEYLLEMDKFYPMLKMSVLRFLKFDQLNILIRTQPLMSKLFSETQILAAFCYNLTQAKGSSAQTSILEILEEYLDQRSTNLQTLQTTDVEFILGRIFLNCKLEVPKHQYQKTFSTPEFKMCMHFHRVLTTLKGRLDSSHIRPFVNSALQRIGEEKELEKKISQLSQLFQVSKHLGDEFPPIVKKQFLDILNNKRSFDELMKMYLKMDGSVDEDFLNSFEIKMLAQASDPIGHTGVFESLQRVGRSMMQMAGFTSFPEYNRKVATVYFTLLECSRGRAMVEKHSEIDLAKFALKSEILAVILDFETTVKFTRDEEKIVQGLRSAVYNYVSLLRSREILVKDLMYPGRGPIGQLESLLKGLPIGKDYQDYHLKRDITMSINTVEVFKKNIATINQFLMSFDGKLNCDIRTLTAKFPNNEDVQKMSVKAVTETPLPTTKLDEMTQFLNHLESSIFRWISKDYQLDIEEDAEDEDIDGIIQSILDDIVGPSLEHFEDLVSRLQNLDIQISVVKDILDMLQKRSISLEQELKKVEELVLDFTGRVETQEKIGHFFKMQKLRKKAAVIQSVLICLDISDGYPEIENIIRKRYILLMSISPFPKPHQGC